MAWNLHVSWTVRVHIRITQSAAWILVKLRGKKSGVKNCSVLQLHSMILGKSRKIKTFTSLDTPCFNDVSGYRTFHAPEKVHFRENTGPDTWCTRCVSGTRFLSIFPVFKEYGFVSRNIGTATRLIFVEAVYCKLHFTLQYCCHGNWSLIPCVTKSCSEMLVWIKEECPSQTWQTRLHWWTGTIISFNFVYFQKAVSGSINANKTS